MDRDELRGCVTRAAYWCVTFLITTNYDNQHAKEGIAESLTGVTLGAGCGEGEHPAAAASRESWTRVFKDWMGAELHYGVMDAHQHVGQEHGYISLAG